MTGLALSLLLAAAPADFEAKASRAVALEFERVGKQTPVVDKALSRAARELAARAAAGSAQDAADSLTIALAVSDADAWDPVPRAVVVRASPPEDALQALAERHDISDEPSSHLGVGAVVDRDVAAVVVLLSDRKAQLDPFPRALPQAGGSKALCGELVAPLGKPQIYATAPDGSARKVALSKEEAGRFCAPLSFPREGRYTLELVGRAERGPEVAALLFTDVGKREAREKAAHQPEPTTGAAARPLLLDRINALRHAHESPALREDPALDGIAQAYAERMSAEGFFAHVAPDGVDMRARLKAAGYVYLAAGENLGLANGPLAAHFGIEHSPGHLENLLEPSFTHVGIGVAFRKFPDRMQTILVELMAKPARESQNPLQDAYRVVQDKRSAAGLPMLIRSDTLERLAMDHAARALQEDTPKSELPDSPLHERVFQSLDEVKSASVDVFVADDPTLLSESRSMRDAANDRLGIGAVRGDSKTYGHAKWWVVVIYASTRGR